MITTTSSHSSQRTHRRIQVISLLQNWFAINPVLLLVGIVNILVLIAALIGIFVDHSIITGAPAWIKPAKFAISISIYSFTLLWLLHFIKGHKRLVAAINYSVAFGLSAEMAIIVCQVIRGTSSHFNVSTPFDAMLWNIMGAVIMPVFIMHLVAAILLLRQRLSNPALMWALRLGLLLTGVGMGVAFLMIIPTTQQMAMLHAKIAITARGGHTVGLADGGPGIPFLGWSTVGGDLRIPHFVGLHALQVVPLIGWLIARFPADWLRSKHRVALISTFSASYLGLLGLLTWQALRAQSIIAPDATTLQAFAILLSITALVASFIIIQARISSKEA